MTTEDGKGKFIGLQCFVINLNRDFSLYKIAFLLLNCEVVAFTSEDP